MDKGLAGDSEKEALYVHIRPPAGGAELKGVAASRLASPPASRRRLGRLLAWGMLPPGPLGLRPLCALAHGPRLLPTKREAAVRMEIFKKSAAGRGNWSV